MFFVPPLPVHHPGVVARSRKSFGGHPTVCPQEVLAGQLTKAIFNVNGKSTFKEEFVTAGGINLKEINFKTYESKLHKNLYFAGEVVNVDAVTGGFNFQNAWTGAFIAAQHILK